MSINFHKWELLIYFAEQIFMNQELLVNFAEFIFANYGKIRENFFLQRNLNPVNKNLIISFSQTVMVKTSMFRVTTKRYLQDFIGHPYSANLVICKNVHQSRISQTKTEKFHCPINHHEY